MAGEETPSHLLIVKPCSLVSVLLLLSLAPRCGAIQTLLFYPGQEEDCTDCCEVCGVPTCRECHYSDKLLIPSPRRCDAFLQCSTGGVEFEMYCSCDLYFNPDINQCDFPENVDCDLEWTGTCDAPDNCATSTLPPTPTTSATITTGSSSTHEPHVSTDTTTITVPTASTTDTSTTNTIRNTTTSTSTTTSVTNSINSSSTVTATTTYATDSTTSSNSVTTASGDNDVNSSTTSSASAEPSDNVDNLALFITFSAFLMLTPLAIGSACLFPSIRMLSTTALNVGIFGLMVASTGAGVSLLAYARHESNGTAWAFFVRVFVILLGISLMYLIACWLYWRYKRKKIKPSEIDANENSSTHKEQTFSHERPADIVPDGVAFSLARQDCHSEEDRSETVPSSRRSSDDSSTWTPDFTERPDQSGPFSGSANGFKPSYPITFHGPTRINKILQIIGSNGEATANGMMADNVEIFPE